MRRLFTSTPSPSKGASVSSKVFLLPLWSSDEYASEEDSEQVFSPCHDWRLVGARVCDTCLVRGRSWGSFLCPLYLLFKLGEEKSQ